LDDTQNTVPREYPHSLYDNPELRRQILGNWFIYHPPKEGQTERYQMFRDKCAELAIMIIENTPTCADQTAALRKLRDMNMAINLTIACNE
jgi:hypothetical protein